jgi:hypothetical protein
MHRTDKALDMSPLSFLRKKKYAYKKYNETTFIIWYHIYMYSCVCKQQQ